MNRRLFGNLFFCQAFVSGGRCFDPTVLATHLFQLQNELSVGFILARVQFFAQGLGDFLDYLIDAHLTNYAECGRFDSWKVVDGANLA